MKEKIKFIWEVLKYILKPLGQLLTPLWLKIQELLHKIGEFYYAKTEKKLTLKEKWAEKTKDHHFLWGLRGLSVFLLLSQIGVMFYLYPHKPMLVDMLILYVPMAYLILRGYRLVMVLSVFVLWYIAVKYFFVHNMVALVGLIFLTIIILCLYLSFKAENTIAMLRFRGEEPKKKNWFCADFVFALLLFGIFNVYTTLVTNWQTQAEKEARAQAQRDLMEAAAYVIYHQRGYSDYCQKEGYELKEYPQAFNDAFASSVRNIEKALSKQDNSLKKMYLNFRGSNWSQTLRQIDKEMNELRRDTIIKRFAKELHVTVAEVRYTQDMENTMTLSETCKLFDEEHEKFLKMKRREFEFIKRYQ